MNIYHCNTCGGIATSPQCICCGSRDVKVSGPLHLLIMEWNTFNIIKWHVESYREMDEYPEMSDDELFNLVARDSFIFDDEWHSLCDELTNWIAKHNPDGDWHCEVSGFGWRSLDGHKAFTAETGKELLAAVLPKADCEFKVYQDGDKGLKIQNFHHDAPTGKEWYTLWPAQRCEWCGDIIPFGADGVFCCEDCKLDSEEEGW